MSEELRDLRVADLMPGLWVDGNNDYHFSVPEIHAFLEIEDTPESRQETMDLLEILLRALPKDARPDKIIRRDKIPTNPAQKWN